MKIYCTPCCKEKRRNKELIESNKRYISDRIKAIYNKGKKDNVGFRIFSGKFGLLKPEEKIPWYDYKLTMERMPNLSKKVKKQLSSQKIDKVVFFTENLRKDLELKPYLALIKDCCNDKNISLEIKYIKEKS